MNRPPNPILDPTAIVSGPGATLGVCAGVPPVEAYDTPAIRSTTLPAFPIHMWAVGVAPFAWTVTAMKYQLPVANVNPLLNRQRLLYLSAAHPSSRLEPPLVWSETEVLTPPSPNVQKL